MRFLGVLAASAAVLSGAVAVLAHGLAAPDSTWLAPAMTSVPGAREVALTFDDGPSMPYTAQVLDVLRERGVKATFFLCGANAERYPELVRRIRDEGHEIGNHTHSHPYLHLMSRERIAAEIDRTQEVLERIAGRRPRFFRPPFGVRWFTLGSVLAERGLTMVLWTARGYEGRLPAPGIARAVLKALKPGGIIVLHDGFETKPPALVDRAEMVRSLPAIIDGARRAGYAFVPLPG